MIPTNPPSVAKPSWVADPTSPRAERFILGPELGQGGMGRVHLAWDPMLQRMCALKLLKGDEPELHQRMLREARCQAKLVHPNICRIFDVGITHNRPFIAMEFLKGKSLAELGPGLEVKQLAEIMADVAGAVDASHRAGLIHRDLKPANILLTEGQDGKAKPYVVDFGLAQDLLARNQTLSWAVLGTPAFMSPEQARGEALGPATDIYSLGATLFALLSGEPPFECTTLGKLITLQATTTPKALRKEHPAIPRDLEIITLKCLETEPHRRYESARALEDDLRRWVAGEPILARSVGSMGRLWRWARRKPALASSIAAGLLGILVLGGWNLRMGRMARIQTLAAQRFGMEIRDAEHLLRIERMLPRHDIRPAEARLRGRMDSIRKEMNLLGAASQGPGLYALGRGELALRDYPKAINTLNAAWEKGFQAPEVAYSIGIAHYRQFLASSPDSFWAFTRPDFETTLKSHLDPAMTWFKRGEGAAVDPHFYGRGLIAMVSGQTTEAERLFNQALAEAPWFYEAILGKVENRKFEMIQAFRIGKRKPEMAEVFTNSLGQQELLKLANGLAPSDEEIFMQLGWLQQALWIERSTHGDRGLGPLEAANAYFGRAREIRPDSISLLVSSSNAALQLGFVQLSSGGNPVKEVARAARNIANAVEERPDLSQNEKTNFAGLRHHLWWVASEAAVRFGRDPSVSLMEAAKARREFGRPEVHFGFSLMLEAMHLEAKGLDPLRSFEEAGSHLENLFSTQPEQKNNFFARMVLGEIHLLRAEFLHRKHQNPSPWIERALGELKVAVEKDPAAAYPYYRLPRAHALEARIAIQAKQDASPSVKAALAAAARGLAINPRNAQIQQAAADAHLADGQARAAAGRDPGPALEAARRALEAADAVNPRDFRSYLLRAEVAKEAAAFVRAGGGDPARELERLEQACRKGLGIKGDERRFRMLLAEAQAFRKAPSSVVTEAAKAGSLVG